MQVKFGLGKRVDDIVRLVRVFASLEILRSILLRTAIAGGRR